MYKSSSRGALIRQAIDLIPGATKEGIAEVKSDQTQFDNGRAEA
jgi:hypothetical protein